MIKTNLQKIIFIIETKINKNKIHFCVNFLMYKILNITYLLIGVV